MPLLDHFHEPTDMRRRWESFHSFWCVAIASELNRRLPPRFFAGVDLHLGSQVAADVAEFDNPPPVEAHGPGGVAVQTYAPPVPVLTMPGVFPDEVEVLISDSEEANRLVAVVELASPGNKDREDKRLAFAAKCASYLHRGVGLIVIDVVTNRTANLHNNLVRLMDLAEPYLMNGDPTIYAVAYRPTQRSERSLIDVWPFPLEVGQSLPTLPLALKGVGCIPLNLEESYMEARRVCRLG